MEVYSSPFVYYLGNICYIMYCQVSLKEKNPSPLYFQKLRGMRTLIGTMQCNGVKRFRPDQIQLAE